MGYLALLFCPDEKTARTVTQVLSELEFNVESCIEPFAAVKKLMGQHFDAVVVDCDNEQNATLLFKSARNSTSNQASLAVAVVEGQAGVAKAFRIGANLVLTKPINIEQAKGTLRVARGLLRKGEPPKPGAVVPTPAASAPAPAASPIKPAPKTVPPLRSAAPAATPASVPHPATPPAAKPAAPAWPAPAAAASSTPTSHDSELPKIGADDSTPMPPAAAPVASAFNESGARIFQAPVAPSAAAVGKPAFNFASSAGSGAASAPAPAREIQPSHVSEKPAATAAHAAEGLLEKSAEAAPSDSPSFVGSAPSFSFGGASAEPESGGGKKIFIGIAAAVIVAGALYFGWSKFQGHATEPASIPAATTSAPVATPQAAKPNSTQPSPSAPTSSASVPSSQPAAVPAKTHLAPATTSDSEEASGASPVSSKPSASSSASSKPVVEEKPAAAPLVVKGGKAPAVQPKSAQTDTAAPSMIGLATSSAGAPPPNLVATEESGPKPTLETLNISQGVSQGLLLKKVQPIYPRNALSMRIEGSVELLATISKTGDISRVKVTSGEPQLSKAAADAVKQWKYKPYLLNGEPVEIQTQVTINFRLPR